MINEHDIKDMSPADSKQIAGDHYKKLDPEPWNVIIKWNLGYLEGTALKYIARWRDKGGIDDIKKAIHFLEKLVEIHSSKSDPHLTPVGAAFKLASEQSRAVGVYPSERLYNPAEVLKQSRNSNQPLGNGDALSDWVQRVNAQKALDDYHAQ